MKYLFQFFLLFAFLMAISTSCKKDSSKSKAAKLDSLKIEIDSLRLAVEKAWDTMIYEDNKKLDYVKRMVDEAVYVLNVSEVDQNKLHSDIEALRNFRYDRQSMSDSELIDAYDNATDSTLRMVFTFIDSIDNSNQVPLIVELRKDIMQMDNMVINRRSHYDEPAMEINSIIKHKSKMLRKLGEPYASMEPYPLFVLNPDI
ncbi:MAG: hypothetical protein RH860_03945 [Cytophagales bacterium]